jgi:hypothetical protein
MSSAMMNTMFGGVVAAVFADPSDMIGHSLMCNV